MCLPMRVGIAVELRLVVHGSVVAVCAIFQVLFMDGICIADCPFGWKDDGCSRRYHGSPGVTATCVVCEDICLKVQRRRCEPVK